jgi:glucose-1-phosphate thymidylyltransferase
MKAILLAGGFATRLWPLTEYKAKPLLLLKDRPILSHIMDALPEDVQVIVSTNAAFKADFEDWKMNYEDRDVTIFIEDSESDEGKKGALGATAHCIDLLGIDEDLMLIAGDNYFGFAMQKFIEDFSAHPEHPLLAAYDIKDKNEARKFGVVVTQGDQITEFQEKPEHPKSSLVSTGCYLFPKSTLKHIAAYAKEQKDNLGGIFEYFMKQGITARAFMFSEPWFDIGSFEAYLAANRALIGNQAIITPGVIQEGKNEFIGSVFIAPGTRVKNCILEDVIVLSDCTLEDCVIRRSVIDEECTLRHLDLTHKMIRQGSKIEKK